jgi:hypothetical protein
MTTVLLEGTVIPEPNYIFYYILSGVLATAFVWLLIFVANSVKKTFDAMIVRIQEITLEQALQKKDIMAVNTKVDKQENKIERLERVAHNSNEELANMIVSKIQAR